MPGEPPEMRPLRIAALAKQIPEFEKMEMGADGRLVRDGLPLEMSAYDRRAVAQGVALAAASGGRCTVITLGPPSAEDVLRESIAFGADDGVLVTDPAFAGSDTLATARALAAVLEQRGPFDLVLVGRNSVDAETGQVGPQVAELLDLPFATGVKRVEVDPDGRSVYVSCELDDEWVELTVALPAVLSAAERLIDPVKIKDPAVWASVDPTRIERLGARSLGVGPWGQAGSETWVGEVRVESSHRLRRTLAGPVARQVGVVVDALADAGLIGATGRAGLGLAAGVVPTSPDPSPSQPVIGVLVEPGRPRVLRELLGAAAELAAELGGRVVAIGPWLLAPESVSDEATTVLAGWGADELIVLASAAPDLTTAAALTQEDVASVVADWTARAEPTIVLAPGTAWGREVAGRVAARRGAGLTGDATALELDAGRLVGWKPAFGGAMLAAVHSRSVSQIVTVRAGVLPTATPRAPATIAPTVIEVWPRGRVRVRARRRDDDLEVLARASRVLSVGRGVAPADYPRLEGLRRELGAELAATRKVTDEGWLPHARQVGITGVSLAPDLAVVIGTSGKFNHMVGFRRAGLIVAVNLDPTAPVFGFADYGIVGDWREVVPELELRLAESRT